MKLAETTQEKTTKRWTNVKMTNHFRWIISFVRNIFCAYAGSYLFVRFRRTLFLSSSSWATQFIKEWQSFVSFINQNVLSKPIIIYAKICVPQLAHSSKIIYKIQSHFRLLNNFYHIHITHTMHADTNINKFPCFCFSSYFKIIW